jgi:hypothetical protein
VSLACLEFPGFRAYREYPGSVNLGFRAIPAFLASQVIRANREFQGFPALEQSHNWRRSVQTRLWRSKNFYSRLIS